MIGTIQIYKPNIKPLVFKNLDELINGLDKIHDTLSEYHFNQYYFGNIKSKLDSTYLIDIFIEVETNNKDNQKNVFGQNIADEYNYYIELPPASKFINIQQYRERIRKLKNDQIKRMLNGNSINNEYCYKLHNLFENRNITFFNSDIETIFTDSEVVKLCERLASPFIRKLCMNHVKNKDLLHQAAMKCYKKYGGYVISFLLSLPKLTFANNLASKANITIEEFDGLIHSFNIQFDKGTPAYKFNFNYNFSLIKNEVITIRNSIRGVTEGYITLDGYYKYRLDSESLNPLFFIDNMNNSTSTFYAGIEEGNCINCGRPLNDPNSLRIGHGPDCAKNLGICN
jgi:hypothetical protein